MINLTLGKENDTFTLDCPYLNLSVASEDIQKLFREFVSDLLFVHQEYGLGDPGKMTVQSQSLRKKIRGLML